MNFARMKNFMRFPSRHITAVAILARTRSHGCLQEVTDASGDHAEFGREIHGGGRGDPESRAPEAEEGRGLQGFRSMRQADEGDQEI